MPLLSQIRTGQRTWKRKWRTSSLSTCCKVFQSEYTYQACKPGVKEQIVDMAMDNGGIRDTAHILKVATATVMKTLKNSRPET
ncbi:hypothetical protein ID850_07400 [Xenorhabdus sp. Flor]|uniref:IS1-like element transposase n=1 Tax=Xenorhabdus cabanillasii TaxID=351673 RepID=UPI0019B24EC6|nr:IS1-like element transposase [Xenorhabdus sp. Flor]MBD2814592.1 hypothetical protein [Xenorhabdus sp. Flor]